MVYACLWNLILFLDIVWLLNKLSRLKRCPFHFLNYEIFIKIDKIFFNGFVNFEFELFFFWKNFKHFSTVYPQVFAKTRSQTFYPVHSIKNFQATIHRTRKSHKDIKLCYSFIIICNVAYHKIRLLFHKFLPFLEENVYCTFWSLPSSSSSSPLVNFTHVLHPKINSLLFIKYQVDEKQEKEWLCIP